MIHFLKSNDMSLNNEFLKFCETVWLNSQIKQVKIEVAAWRVNIY